MKWVLVTTNPAPYLPGTAHPDDAGWNIGDVFARLGTEELVREVDPSAEIALLNMDCHRSITTEQEFDRVVLAGRPLFWPGCESHALWTHVLGGWAGRDPRRVLILGAGDCYPRRPPQSSLMAAIMKAAAHAWRLVLRFSFDAPTTVRSVCPSTWILTPRPNRQRRKLCNFMAGGGHYPNFACAADIVSWQALEPILSECLMRGGFDFVAHTLRERQHALGMGWPSDRIVYADTIEPYLEAYAAASHYIGNRMHGAAVLAGRPARILAIGFDSRLGMVSRAGGMVRSPSELSLLEVAEFCESRPAEQEARRVPMIARERQRMAHLLAEFAK